jgi:hypothetical protein
MDATRARRNRGNEVRQTWYALWRAWRFADRLGYPAEQHIANLRKPAFPHVLSGSNGSIRCKLAPPRSHRPLPDAVPLPVRPMKAEPRLKKSHCLAPFPDRP